MAMADASIKAVIQPVVDYHGRWMERHRLRPSVQAPGGPAVGGATVGWRPFVGRRGDSVWIGCNCQRAMASLAAQQQKALISSEPLWLVRAVRAGASL